MLERRRSRKRIHQALNTDLRYMPEQPMQIIDGCAYPGVREHWAPRLSADEICLMIYAHCDIWPDDHPILQGLISDAFLYRFPGPEGDCFRHMVWPPPLSRYTERRGG